MKKINFNLNDCKNVQLEGVAVICNFAASKNGKVDAPVQKMYFHHL